jgi:hypothetical protein
MRTLRDRCCVQQEVMRELPAKLVVAEVLRFAQDDKVVLVHVLLLRRRHIFFRHRRPFAEEELV